LYAGEEVGIKKSAPEKAINRGGLREPNGETIAIGKLKIQSLILSIK
jgi:hypothetical protein